MRIEGSRANDIMASDASKQRPVQAQNGERTAQTEQVSISSAAKELSVADSAKQNKIEALKRSIESGTYRVEPDKVAAAMIRHMQRSKGGA